MRSRLITAALCLLLGIALFAILGGADAIGRWAAAFQREYQGSIAAAVQSLRKGDAGAIGVLATVCFAYGFFHAVGPGHGKVLIGGYGLGRPVRAWRISAVAVMASIAQAVTAVLLVYGGFSVLELGRPQMERLAEDMLAPASYAAIALMGVWLVWRGLRGLRVFGRATEDAACSHTHGPSPEQIASAGGWRETAALVGAVAIRPCTGAIFLLIICWQFGIQMAGLIGALAMALGTAAVTVAAGLAAVTIRAGALAMLAGPRVTGLVIPGLEVVAGVTIVLAAGSLLQSVI